MNVLNVGINTRGRRYNIVGKKLPYTPNTQIKNALRRLWMYSRERRAAIAKMKNACEQCDSVGSMAKGKVCKIQVHHKRLIDWEKIFKVVRRELLVAIKHLEVLCKECHKEETDRQRKEGWGKK